MCRAPWGCWTSPFRQPKSATRSTTPGTVFRTADAGLSWSILSSGGGAPAALLAPSVNTVLLTGARGVRRSTNAGASFAEVNATVLMRRAHHRARKVKLSNFDLSGGAQIAGGAIFAYGSDVLESTDGGAHWTLIPRPLPNACGRRDLLRQPDQRV